MRYTGKIWLDKLMSMNELAEKLELENITIYCTDDVVGTMKWRGENILVLLHLSWGDIRQAEKIKVFVHHLEDTEDSEFWKLIGERLKDFIR